MKPTRLALPFLCIALCMCMGRRETRADPGASPVPPDTPEYTIIEAVGCPVREVAQMSMIDVTTVVMAEVEEPVTEYHQFESEPWYTPEELEWMAIVIFNEAGGDAASDETRIMVGNVVLNRVADERFPDTIYEVLTQERQYGLFHRTGIQWASRAVHEPEAVERAYECARRVMEGERLLPDNVVWQAEFRQGAGVHVYQDNTYFCF